MSHDPEPSTDLEPDEHAIDALLREHLSGEATPDLTTAVLERHRRGDGARAAVAVDGAAAPAARPATHPLLAAALVLLGIGAVLGTIWLAGDGGARDRTGDRATPAGIQDPKPTPAEQDPKPAPTEGERANEGEAQPKGNVRKPAKLPFELPQREDGGDERFLLRVIDHKGGPVQSFRFSVIGVSKGESPAYGGIPGLRDLRREPRDFAVETGMTAVDGLHPGRYIVLVDDGLHAPTTSAPFFVETGEAVEVTTRLDMGGSIRGVVRDERGAPVAGATVATGNALPRGIVGDSPFADLLVERVANLRTERSVVSGEDGTFTLPRLRPAGYAVSVTHPGYCANTQTFVTVPLDGEGAAPTPTIVLRDGALVHGTALRDGEPIARGRIKVEEASGQMVLQVLSMTSDSEGRFVASHRLPPGDYTISCSVKGTDNPMEALIQQRDSQRKFTIKAGQERVEQDVWLR